MNDINLVPSQYQKSFKRKWYIGLGMLGGILSIIILVFLAFIPIYQIGIEQEEQVWLDKRLNSEELAEVKNLIEETKKIHIEKSNIDLILKQIDIPSHISRKTMDIIVDGAPKGLRMNEVIIQGLENSMTIRGNAKNIANVAEYIVGLYKTDQFEKITYTTNQSKNSEVEGWIEYNVEIQLKSLIEEEQDEEPGEEMEEDTDEAGGEDIL